jgi:diazepam-binding inhibitor (GABA receptor modulating acyl-CoA-binding protein)
MQLEQYDTEFFELLEKCKEGGIHRPKIDKQSTDVKLQTYGLGRQGKDGDCTESKPGMFDFKGKAKWEAWMKVKGTSKEQAQKEFVKLVKKIISS